MLKILCMLLVLFAAACEVRAGACECAATVDEVDPDVLLQQNASMLGVEYNTYGIGCYAHDAKREDCTKRRSRNIISRNKRKRNKYIEYAA